MSGAGLAAIEAEMARQAADAVMSVGTAGARAAEIAALLRKMPRLLLLGMGASHAAGRIVEPLYRGLGIDAVALPLSEQLTAPLPLAGKVVLVASQSGESAEVVRWLGGGAGAAGAVVFGMTLDGSSTLARAVPSLVGAGGAELGFAATRSLTVTLALHAAVLAALGLDVAPALAALRETSLRPVDAAVAALDEVQAVVCSGRELHGMAEALALGITELSRLPAFALEGGQFRHGPLEMLGPKVGVVLVRGAESGATLLGGAAATAVAAGSPVVIFDSSEAVSVAGAVTLAWPPAQGLAAAFAMLPTAQRFMLGLAAARVAEVGTPRRSSKITRDE